MSAGPDEISLWSKLATAGAGVLTGLVSLVWADYRKRVEKVETGLGRKADKEEMDRQRDNIAGIFERLGKVEISSARIEEQLLRYSSDIESEKRTRARSNDILNQKLDRILERRSQKR